MTRAHYDRFSDQVFRWGSIDDFLRDSAWSDGIHAIRFAGGHFDVLLRGGVTSTPDLRALPVFFSGAVQRDATAPPFFSGTTLAGQVGVPVVAISDPTLHCSNDVSIGWYTGGSGEFFQAALPGFLLALREAVGREIVLVGGSAGGFASLFYASAVGCGAFVWNPQTDLLRYGAWAVREYLVAVLGDQSWSYPDNAPKASVEPVDLEAARAQLSAAGIESTVGPAGKLTRLLYLQNRSDHHLQRHAEPYRDASGLEHVSEGLYGSSTHVMAVSSFSEGHRAPRREIIEAGLELAITPDADLLAAAGRLSML